MKQIKDPAKWQILYADRWDIYQYLFWTVSVSEKFAFIHVPRCAGTSMCVRIRGSVPDARRGFYVFPEEYDSLLNQ